MKWPNKSFCSLSSSPNNNYEIQEAKKIVELVTNLAMSKLKSSLPDDLILSCLARVSRLYYPTLSFVSKSFRCFIASPELYQTRSLLGQTETCLYAISDEVAVSFLDCRTHTWLEAPSLRLTNTQSKLDGEMYLPGSCENPDSFNCIEVVSKKTQTLKPQRLEKPSLGVLDLQGKVYMIHEIESGKKGVVLNFKDLTWEVVGLGGNNFWASVGMIENIVYSYNKRSGEFLWLYFDKEEEGARKLKGLEGLPKFDSGSTVRLVNYGGKLMVLWDQNVPASDFEEEKMIWCAEISLDKRKNDEIWGKVEWFEAVLTVPKAYQFVCAIAATV
ncbi:putative F-box/kelch-repeat protein At4g39600 isoform X2 [Arabidopsis lyrata subsp. lyrata]|uniref:putative F-box/kelch-repeat protein At4g39600 isoform X2 n=1 Tax=Arabidopsis lyrata subsp. lyrata TaxID=81972 RepID=UPI000A29A570|nr:putative F-box/kelch-repeat protein At4g39600 isoform X2 [Arabidopsis lyrata subsp. lyrata]|eukprot:XP_020875752.1 putative F-box/kelch-repeat protein At4g39600 isoform X2 [Arabidopsis lyrata subsp. lyrata]